MRTGSIYIIKNTVNDKVYIGQTVMTVRERFMTHMKPSTSKKKGSYKLYNAVNKYGKDKFYVETLEEGIPVEQLDEKEIAYIQQYNSFLEGYNSTPGGDGRIINKVTNEEYMLDMAKCGIDSHEIAKVFGVNKATVIRTLHKLGFYYHVDRQRVYALSKAGMANKDIAAELGCHPYTVHRILESFNIRKRKERMVQRKDFDYESFELDYVNQMPICEICKKYNITKSTFYRIKKARSLETRPQIYKYKVRYHNNSVKCNDYGGSSSRREDELPVEAH